MRYGASESRIASACAIDLPVCAALPGINQPTKGKSKMRSHLLGFMGVAVACIACSGSPPEAAVDNSESSRIAPRKGGTETSLGRTKWVYIADDFGPCGVLPASCRVGAIVSAHTGPGTEGGCAVFECKLLGDWVRTGDDFGPCGELPSSCLVGETASAHSGAGTADGCSKFECR
jgi:hypothetical protein